MKILTNYDFNKNQLLNPVIQKLATPPANPVSGQIYYDTIENRLFTFNGTEWVGADALGATMTGSDIVTAINASGTLIDDNNLSAEANDAISKRHTHSNKTALDGTTASYTTAEKSKLAGIETGAEVNNISDLNVTDLTGSGDTNLHYHSTDRNRVNHTGTQPASTISDFDTEVANNTTVSANTSARHTHSNKTILDNTTASFTKAGQNKLDGIQEGAEVNVNADWDASSGDAQILNKPTTISGYGITDAYTKGEIDNKVSAVYKYKGSVLTRADLPSKNQVIGDVYNVQDTGKNYAWDGTGWDDIGGTEPLATGDNHGLLNKKDFSKLAGIESGATADQSPTEILTAIKTVDGTSSGLDADLLDGKHASAFSLTAHNHDGTYEPADSTILKDADIGTTVQGYNANTVIDSGYVHTDNNYTTVEKNKLAGIEASANNYSHPTDGGGSRSGLSGATVISGITVNKEGHVTGTTTRKVSATDVGATQKKSFPLGDGSATSFILNHKLNSRDVVVSIRESASPYAMVITDVEMTTVNTVTVKFAQAPNSGEYTATIIG